MATTPIKLTAAQIDYLQRWNRRVACWKAKGTAHLARLDTPRGNDIHTARALTRKGVLTEHTRTQFRLTDTGRALAATL